MKHHRHPAERKRVGKFDFARPKNPPPGQHDPRQDREGPRKPPREMQGEEDPPRHIVVGVPGIRFAREMHQPFARRELLEETRMPPLQPNVPRRRDEQENRESRPSAAARETGSALPDKSTTAEEESPPDRAARAGFSSCRRAPRQIQNPINHPRRPAAVRSRGSRNRSRRDERAEERLGHEDPAENKRAATAEMDQPRQKTAPRSAQPIADEESKRDRSDSGEREREPGRRRR